MTTLLYFEEYESNLSHELLKRKDIKPIIIRTNKNMKFFNESYLEFNGVSEIINMMAGDVGGISDTVVSEDSNLSTTCDTLSQTLKEIATKMTEICDSIIDEITKYAQQTLENETGTSKSLDDINTELDSINSILDSLDENGKNDQDTNYSYPPNSDIKVTETTSRGNPVG